jgi:uncharacterized membrane protein (UPF0182 family)
LFGASERATTAAAPATPGQAATPATAAPSATPATWERLAGDARDAYQRALEAQRAGDWAKYGEEIRRLGEILERLKQQK